jgi:glucokinase
MQEGAARSVGSEQSRQSRQSQPSQQLAHSSPDPTWVVVGLDNGGTCNNATVLTDSGEFLVDHLVENPSRVNDGPEIAVASLAASLDAIIDLTGVPRTHVRAVGLDTPGPASADGIISSKGATNFSEVGWHGFDFRGALETRIAIPVVYNNDGNAAALYAHHAYYGDRASEHSSVAAIVGTGLGGGVVEAGRIVKGAAGMAGELGHVHIPMEGLLADGQPTPTCNCGFVGDAESVASLSAIERNLLPYWLTQYPGHPLAGVDPRSAARQVRSLAERGDPLAREIFEQQARAIGRLFTIASNFLDPNVYFVGGGVVETAPEFREWFLSRVRASTALRGEQIDVAHFAVVPDLDMAGARGAAIAARAIVIGTTG